jgi:hypothetical protein
MTPAVHRLAPGFAGKVGLAELLFGHQPAQPAGEILGGDPDRGRSPGGGRDDAVLRFGHLDLLLARVVCRAFCPVCHLRE